MREFKKMNEWLPEINKNGVEVVHFRNDTQACALAAIRGDYISPNITYTKLIVNGSLWMSDTEMEKNTNWNFIRCANGHVLIFGLGMGMIIIPLLLDKEIKSITVIEINPFVASDIGSLLKVHDKRGILNIVNADANIYFSTLSKGSKFDTIYFDIWKDICTDNLENIKFLEKNYRKFLNKENPYRFMDCWQKTNLQRISKRENKYSYCH